MPDPETHDLLDRHLSASVQVLQAAAASNSFRISLRQVAEVMTESLKNGGKIMFAGNGGSAADAQHIAGEFVSRLNFDRAPLAALALTVDTSVLTAIGNDYGYEHVFERQVRGLGRPGDVFVGISTSGRSPNILRAIDTARELGLRSVGFGGEGQSGLSERCELMI
ncbi:MAG: SIS domain-containing protein, partial [Pseudorhodoplanes sp.]